MSIKDDETGEYAASTDGQLDDPRIILTRRKVIRDRVAADIATAKSIGELTPANKRETQVMLSTLRRHALTLARLDDAVLSHGPASQDGLEGEISEALDYQMQLGQLIDEFDWRLRELDGSPVGPTGGSRMMPVQTPKLELTKFDGNPLHWQAFWDDFSCSVDVRTDLSPIDKFKLLKQSLEGEALGIVTHGYFLTIDGYKKVKEQLKDRFGDPQIAIFAHFEALLDLKPATHEVDSLLEIRDRCEAHIRNLEALGLTEDTFGQVFAPILLSKLPRFVKIELHRQNGSNKWTLSTLRALLKDEIFARAKSDKAFGAVNPDGAFGPGTRKPAERGAGVKKPNHTGAALLVQAEKQKASGKKKGKRPVRDFRCAFCGNHHRSWECDRYRTVADRQAQIGTKCFRCLRDNHTRAECRETRSCYYCGKSDHCSSLCYKQFGAAASTSQNKGLLVQGLNPTADEFVPVACVNTVQGRQPHRLTRGTAVLESALVLVTGQTGSALARIVFDTGSTLSFVRKELGNKIGAKWVGSALTSIGRFGEAESKHDRFPVRHLQLTLRDGSGLGLNLREVSNVSTPIQLIPLDSSALPAELDTSELAEMLVDAPQSVDIDLLIGLDYYHDIVGPEQWRGPTGLIIKQTSVGKILTGFLRQDSNRDVNVQLCVIERVESTSRSLDLERFWSLEDIGIKDSPGSRDDEVALEHFKSTVRFKDGRYEVQWAFKSANPELPTNYTLALRRLNSVYRKLFKDPTLAAAYHQIFQDQLEKGIIEIAPTVPDGIEHYLPHQAVVTPGKETTKVRVVLDASARESPQSLSLNDTMYRGPVFLNDLVGMLLRFRMPVVAIVSDVEKAFLQIALQREHRDCTRFLWVKCASLPPTPDNIVIYRYTRVTFGMRSSPFLLAATIIHHMLKRGTPTAIEIKDNTYMDNSFGGRANTAQAIDYYREAKDLFRQISMNLREWYSNDHDFIATLAEPDRGKSPTPSVLGLKWNTAADTLRCPCAAPPSPATDMTKRAILKYIASTFDPCGWFSGVTIRGRIIMQDLWKSKKGWDEKVEDRILESWTPAQADIAAISKMELPRRLELPLSSGGINELHVFCDASSRAYAAAVYLKTSAHQKSTGNLVFAKARVAPVKQMTIPKLELMATLLGFRMVQFVTKELHMPVEAKFLWTDSTCVLGWLKSEKVQVVFVENRLKEIRSSSDIAFGHVKTEENPADIPSRGVSLDTLKASELWWKGPAWLKLDQDQWPCKPAAFVPTLPPEPPEIVVRTEAVPHPIADMLIEPRRFSSLQKLLRVTSYVFRFIARLRGTTYPTVISAAELRDARKFWERRAQAQGFPSADRPTIKWENKVKQLGLYRDAENCIRCRGRYANAGLQRDAERPVLLPAEHPLTELIIKESHARTMHTGMKGTLSTIRQRYWIPNGRNAVKRILQQCQTCRRHFGGAFRTPDVGPLPGFRSQLTRPFAVIGLDYMGPLYVRVHGQTERSKVWVALFTCAAIRAIHLEMVNSLSAKDFLLCLRRFMALHGEPDKIVSDNAKQFRAGNRALDCLWQEAQDNEDVQHFAASHGIEWKFVTEKAPWMGGFYERLVALVKHALKASLGGWSLTATELQTLLYEVAFVLNGRPLLYSDDDPADLAITPLHLLFQSRDMFPEVTGDVDPAGHMRAADELLMHWKAGQNLLREFWDVWRNQYLLALRESWRPARDRGVSSIPAEPGAVVLIKDQLPRGMWRVGRIANVRKSGDGKVRSVEVALPGGSTVLRPVKLLYPIEAACHILADTVPGEATNATPAAPSDGEYDRPSRPRRAAAAVGERARRGLA